MQPPSPGWDARKRFALSQLLIPQAQRFSAHKTVRKRSGRHMINQCRSCYQQRCAAL
jgi:hypothetical protein